MAYGLNKVMLIGHVGKDPEVKYTNDSTAVANFSIATNESYKDSSGKLVERTEWHRCVAWRKLAEVIEKHVHKGSKLYVEGKLQTRSWDDKDGNKKYTTEIVVSDMTFLDTKRDGASEAQEGPSEPADEPIVHKSEDENDLPF